MILTTLCSLVLVLRPIMAFLSASPRSVLLPLPHGKQLQFHQIDRKTHKRVRHQNVDEAGKAEKAHIVKGFEYAKDKYIEIDPEESKALRLPTATTVPISQFVKGRAVTGTLR
jgi:non-homologous end joining protein Ku